MADGSSRPIDGGGSFRSMSGYRLAGLVYAVSAAAGTVAFFATFIIFLGNLPKLDEPWLVPSADLGAKLSPPLAVLINIGLLALFSAQHSLMARPSFKKRLARLLPQPLERATYVHAANAAGFLVILFWQPVPVELWHVRDDVAASLLWMTFAVGWLLLFTAAFSIDMLELLGVRQAWAWASNRRAQPLELKTRGLYGRIEHPMYVGVILGLWATPYMTLGHALLATQLTVYILIAMRYERRDLQARFGRSYARWQGGAVAYVHPPPTFAIAAELGRRYPPVTDAALPASMQGALARL